MLTFAVEAWIGNAAAVLSGTWGGVTQRAKQRGYSRTSILAVEPVSLAWMVAQARGVKLANASRQEQAQEPDADVSPPITMGLDVFHTQREVERVLHHQWKQVERQLEVASETDAKVWQYKRRGGDTRGIAGQAGRAWRKAERLFDAAL